MDTFSFVVESEPEQTPSTFWFLVNAEVVSTGSGTGGTNVFPRYSGDAINIDGRDETLDGSVNTDQYALTLVVTPQQIEPNGSASVTVQARKNGLPLAAQLVSLSSSNSAVSAVTASVTTSNTGNAVFSVIGLTIGTTTLSASMVIGGVTYPTLPVVLTVSTQAPPVNYDLTGYGRVVVSVESPLSNALTSRVQRLSHAEQTRKHPGDQGLKWATYFETATVTIVPKVLQT